jgi:hypothetical protein
MVYLTGGYTYYGGDIRVDGRLMLNLLFTEIGIDVNRLDSTGHYSLATGNIAV